VTRQSDPFPNCGSACTVFSGQTVLTGGWFPQGQRHSLARGFADVPRRLRLNTTPALANARAHAEEPWTFDADVLIGTLEELSEQRQGSP
jgi:hypothetical protein